MGISVSSGIIHSLKFHFYSPVNVYSINYASLLIMEQ